ncbi:LacI family DNA-binding transcriptional regulator [Roseibium limicola]|uniref:LacI family DNA-binding transcriptional regulator n=1 Tax=Roseibium limicola TaxID=2816037 RepID=A0A939J9V2_9HYPH|nr:LacI family DNA-binding transcriptional regulator [Roseibium limicola]MBO0346299.1 LacI family DNA-binding transcriptional regulator [Roseibium limicola]
MSEPIDRPATIEDVAKLAGVSIATVSRALRSPSKVAESTRKKVTAAIARTGYQANAMAQNLRMQRSQMVLVLASSIADPNFAGILTGLEKAANDRGYGVLIGNTEGTIGLEQTYLRFLSTGMADGLVLLTGHIPVAGEPRTPMSSLPPIVATERAVNLPDLSYVGVDDVAASKMATEYLISLGHRRIVFISGGTADIRSDLRHSGYQMGLRESSRDLRDWRVEGDGTSESGRAAIERLFIKDDLPTAFFCFNDNTAIGVISALQIRGYRVPEDFSVLGFDDIPFANNFTPSLTTIRQPRQHIGELAMNLLLDRLANREKSPETHLLHGDLIVRESCSGVQRPTP